MIHTPFRPPKKAVATPSYPASHGTDSDQADGSFVWEVYGDGGVPIWGVCWNILDYFIGRGINPGKPIFKIYKAIYNPNL